MSLTRTGVGEILTTVKATSKYETLISTETPVAGVPTLYITAEPTKSTTM